MNVAVILAGGCGKRSGSKIPKQFILFHDKPLIYYTLKQFDDCPDIDTIIIPCLRNWKKYLRSQIDLNGIKKECLICDGGKTGLESAYKAFIYGGGNSENSENVYLFHDACRPFVESDTISNVAKIAKNKGNAVATVQLLETLVVSPDGLSSSQYIPRKNLQRVMTPQAFREDTLRTLLSSEDEILASEEPSLFSFFMSKGGGVFCVQSNEKNFKITFPQDIDLFRSLA